MLIVILFVVAIVIFIIIGVLVYLGIIPLDSTTTTTPPTTTPPTATTTTPTATTTTPTATTTTPPTTSTVAGKNYENEYTLYDGCTIYGNDIDGAVSSYNNNDPVNKFMKQCSEAIANCRGFTIDADEKKVYYKTLTKDNYLYCNKGLFTNDNTYVNKTIPLKKPAIFTPADKMLYNHRGDPGPYRKQGYVMDIRNKSIDDNAELVVWEPESGTNQLMTLTPMNQIRVKHSGKCLEAPKSMNAVDKVVQKPCDGDTPYQKWYFDEESRLRSFADMSKCMFVQGGANFDGSLDHGAGVGIYNCNGNINQKWYY